MPGGIEGVGATTTSLMTGATGSAGDIDGDGSGTSESRATDDIGD